MSEVATRLIGLAISEPEHTVPIALSTGLDAGDFPPGNDSVIWSELMGMWKEGAAIDDVVLKARLPQLSSYVDAIKDVSGEIDVETYARVIIGESLKRRVAAVSKTLPVVAREGGITDGLAWMQEESDAMAAKWARANSPTIQNPADALSLGKGWATASGLLFLDRLIRFTSGGIHFLAGDPGSGKTSMIVHMLSHNARHGVNSVGVLAESSQLEVSLAMLTQAKAITAGYANQIRYNPGFRTAAKIQEIRELWDTHFGDLPLQVHSVSAGPSEVNTIINSITKPSFICIDHAVAVVAQAEVSKDVREYQTFNAFFSNVKKAAERNDHIILMANQYTKAGRQGEERDADAEFGGSGVRNIAESMVHLMEPKANIETASGFRQMQLTVPKCRAMLVSDQYGHPVDPVRATKNNPVPYYINVRYRKVSSTIPGLES